MHAHARDLGPRPQPGRPLHRSGRPSLITKQTFVGRCARRSRSSRSSFSDYRAGRRRPDRVSGRANVGSQSVERTVSDVKINAPVDAALFKRPLLEPAPAAVVRRGVRRSLRRRADARAARARSLDCTSPASAARSSQAAGGTLVDDYRGISVTGLIEPLAEAAAARSTPAPARRRGARAAARRARPDRFLRLQLPARAGDQGARRAGHLLHQPADLGVAPQAARRRSGRSPIACW